MKRNDKRALSPVIATVLLIAIAVVLAAIVFIWARSFIGERAEKNGASIELSCADVGFEAQASISGSELKVDIVNKKNIPIYDIQIRKKGVGTEKNIGNLGKTIVSGETESAIVSVQDISSGDTIIVSPIILGKVGESTKSYFCSEEYGLPVVVA